MTSLRPFRGLEPFRTIDAPIFCERDRERTKLLQLITLYRGVLLYGDSGVGKSSLVNAGLLPALEAEDLHAERVRFQPALGGEIVVEKRAGDTDVSRLISQEMKVVRSASTFKNEVAEIANDLRERSGKRLLLIFDQFEEIITLTAEASVRVGRAPARRAQHAVINLIMELLHDELLPVKILFVFREDYLAKVVRLLSDAPNLVDQFMRLEPVRTKKVRKLIEDPFLRAEIANPFAPEVVDEIVKLVDQRYNDGYLELSAIQVVCLRLWLSNEPQLDLLRRRGIDGLVEDFLAERIEHLSPRLREAAIVLLCHMVTSTGTRNVISYPDLLSAAADEAVGSELANQALEALEREAHVVTRDGRRDVPFYEIVSEFLVPWIMRQKDQRSERAYLARRRRVLLSAVAVVGFLVIAVVGSFYALFDPLNPATQKSVANAVQSNPQTFLRWQEERTLRQAAENELKQAQARAEAAERELERVRQSSNSGSGTSVEKAP